MKASNSVFIASVIALVSFLTIGITFLINVIVNNSKVDPFLSYTWITLIIISIIGSMFVIYQAVQEKRVNKPDENKATTVTKGITLRINVNGEPVTIEAPDAKTAIEVYQELHKN